MSLVYLYLHLHSEGWIEKTGYTEDADTPKLEVFPEAYAYIREGGVQVVGGYDGQNGCAASD